MSDESDLQKIGKPGTVTLTKEPVRATKKLTKDEAVEPACEAAFDQHVANKVAEGKSIVGSWSLLTDMQKREWRLIIIAAINRWLKAQE